MKVVSAQWHVTLCDGVAVDCPTLPGLLFFLGLLHLLGEALEGDLSVPVVGVVLLGEFFKLLLLSLHLFHDVLDALVQQVVFCLQILDNVFQTYNLGVELLLGKVKEDILGVQIFADLPHLFQFFFDLGTTYCEAEQREQL